MRIGYNYQSLREADVDFNTKIFLNRFKPALEKINGRDFTYDEIKLIIKNINAVIKNNDLGKELNQNIPSVMSRLNIIFRLYYKKQNKNIS